jgi:hypothetical protein
MSVGDVSRADGRSRTRGGWTVVVLLASVWALAACSSDPQDIGPTGNRGELPVSPPPAPTDARPMLPPAATPSPREELHKNMRELTLLLNVNCQPSAAPAAECDLHILRVLTTVRTVRTVRDVVDKDQDRQPLQPAVRIIDQLNDITPDTATVAPNQNRILTVSTELQAWLTKNFTW